MSRSSQTALDAPTPPFGAGEDERRVIEEWQRNLTPLSPRGIG